MKVCIWSGMLVNIALVVDPDIQNGGDGVVLFFPLLWCMRRALHWHSRMFAELALAQN